MKSIQTFKNINSFVDKTQEISIAVYHITNPNPRPTKGSLQIKKTQRRDESLPKSDGLTTFFPW